MWRYADYLAVSEDFIPVFTEEVDANNKENWKFFIPHEQMRQILEKLIAALERANTGDKRSLWLTGAYGTGKTLACFVIKHLLEDNPAEIEAYFQKHKILTPLWPRFKALRENKRYLLVYRSASGHITSSNRRLMIELQGAIEERLRAQGLNTFSGSIMAQLIRKLTDANGIFNWEGAFQKYRARFRTVASAAEVTERLRAGDVKIGEQVAAVLEEEGVSIIDSPEDIKKWIKDVIVGNNLQGIVFIWDEFTEFFSYNVPITPLQELAQAAVDMPFYLLLVTHRALNQFTRIDDDTRRKMLDRFHNCQLEMNPVTAYKLIGNVIEADPEQRNECEAKRDSLWSPVDVSVMHIKLLGGESVTKEDLKKLAPIHPFTAYLLATISRLYSSSQRTLFQFLKSPEQWSFQWFIANYPVDDWYWLTPDYLWRYFFEDVRLESIDAISDILSYYRTVVDDLASEEEKRVFRVMLLLIALCRQTEGAQDLLKPRLSVLTRMFVGTPLYNRAKDVAHELCSRGIMLAVNTGGDQEYLIPTTTIDHNKLQELTERAKATLTFEKAINVGRIEAEFAPSLRELLLLQGAAKLRHPVQIVSAKDLKVRRERVCQGVEAAYEVGVILVVAQEDEHLIDLEPLAERITQDTPNYCVLISQSPFGAKRWAEWLDCRARSWYHAEMRDTSTKKYYDSKTRNIGDEWISLVRTGRIRAFFRGKQEELAGCEAIPEYLGGIVDTVYSCGPEKLSRTATLYDHGWGKKGAEVGLQVAQNIQQPYKDVVEELRKQGLWENGDVSAAKGHPVARMQSLVDERFASQQNVSLRELWDALTQPPYGLMPSPIGILLFGFLLRKYAQGYYYSDGTNSLPLNPNKLAELVEQVIRGNRAADLYTIRKMSPQGERFCRLARSIFHLTEEQAAYPEEARKNMRSTVIQLGYPLWALSYHAEQIDRQELVPGIARATDALGDLLAYERDELNDNELEQANAAMEPVRRELANLLSKDRLQQGMMRFLQIHAIKLLSLMSRLHMDISQVMARLRGLLNEDTYLWREERVQEKLTLLTSDLDLLDALNDLCGVVKTDLTDLRTYFKTTWFKSKLPLLCYRGGQPTEVAGLITYLYELIYGTNKALGDNRADDLRQRKTQLITLLHDSAAATAVLIREFAGETVSMAEAAEVYAALPDLRNAPPEEVRSQLLHALSHRAKQKKLAELRNRWQALTGSDSPQRWSEEKRCPIQWVLVGEAHHSFFARFDRLQQLRESEIDEMLAYLAAHGAELNAFRDQENVTAKFLQTVAGDYSDLVREAGMVDRLLDHIYRVFQGDVYQWPLRLNEIQRAARQWFTSNYKTTAYPQVVKAIEGLSAEEIKRFVREWAAEEPIIGARLLAAIKGAVTKR